MSAHQWDSSEAGYYVPPPLLDNSTVHNENNEPWQQTIVPPAVDEDQRMIPSRTHLPLSRLAGATVRYTGLNQFRVDIEIHVTPDSTTSVVSRILQMWRDPTTLGQWCGLIPPDGTILTTHTHGTTTTEEYMYTSSNENTDRLPYEGEWTQATMSANLCLPSSSCWYTCQQSLLRMFGLAEYTSIRIFAEPVRQTVSITVEPLPGGMVLTQQLTVDLISEHKARLVNCVDLETTMGSSSTWTSFWYPTIQDFMEQTLTSMARLRFCVEELIM
jgi:hypothetical protein